MCYVISFLVAITITEYTDAKIVSNWHENNISTGPLEAKLEIFPAPLMPARKKHYLETQSSMPDSKVLRIIPSKEQSYTGFQFA